MFHVFKFFTMDLINHIYVYEICVSSFCLMQKYFEIFQTCKEALVKNETWEWKTACK